MSETPTRPVISDRYRALQQELHENPNYGVASIGFAPLVQQFVAKLGVASISDYGAGKQNLRKALEAAGVRVDYRPYDPAFPDYGPPQSADLVCCIDVLEHIEPEFLDNVLDDLALITIRYGFFSVHTGPAVKVLADGRNAHLIQQPSSWWLPRLCQRFEVEHLQKTAGGFFVLTAPRA
ncbi:MAG: hypothetical protein ACXU8S_02265 [Phenylobacterium sp.]